MKNIILTSFMGIGDTINIIPLIELLGKQGHNIYVLVYLKPALEILNLNPYIKKSFLIPKEKNPLSNFTFAKKLRQEINPKETIFVATCSHGPRREKFISKFYGAAKEVWIERVHNKSNLVTNLLPFEKNAKWVRPKIYLSDEEEKFKEIYLNEKEISKKDYVVAIHPGCNPDHPERRLPMEDYVRIVKKIISKNKKVFLFLGPGEINMKSFFEESLKDYLEKEVFFISEKDIRKSAALIGRCNEYLGNDSALMHIAEATGVKRIRAFILIDYLGNVPLGKIENAIFDKEKFIEGL